jgi:hypothetical protein
LTDREKIRQRAYQLWEQAGKPDGQLKEEQIKHEMKTPDNL